MCCVRFYAIIVNRRQSAQHRKIGKMIRTIVLAWNWEASMRQLCGGCAEYTKSVLLVRNMDGPRYGTGTFALIRIAFRAFSLMYNLISYFYFDFRQTL